MITHFHRQIITTNPNEPSHPVRHAIFAAFCLYRQVMSSTLLSDRWTVDALSMSSRLIMHSSTAVQDDMLGGSTATFRDFSNAPNTSARVRQIKCRPRHSRVEEVDSKARSASIPRLSRSRHRFSPSLETSFDPSSWQSRSGRRSFPAPRKQTWPCDRVDDHVGTEVCA